MDCRSPNDWVADGWVSVVTRLKTMTSRGRSDILLDDRKVAMCGLRATIEDVSRIEVATAEVLRSIASEVKCSGTRNKGALREILLRSRSNRAKLAAISKKRQSLQQHLETLETSELNQQVLSSVRQTSDVLKSMGLDQRLDSVEELMMDMAESHEDVQSIQNGLSAPLGAEADGADLDAELALLLGCDLEEDIATAAVRRPIVDEKPATSNSMLAPAAAPAAPVREAVREAVSEAHELAR